MGMFKALKDAKALGDYHGGRPSMKDAFNDISSLADDRGEGDILRRGTPTKAVVQGIATPVPDDRFAMQVPLDVYPPDGGAPYRIDYVFPTARMKAALSIGMEIPIKVDPGDMTRIAVQWDAQKAAIASAGGDLAAMAQGLASTYGGVADAAMRQTMAGQGATVGTAAAPSDPLEKIAQLAKLRDSGAITEAEFAAKKTELLSEA
jgi:Short C-terminal domain